MRRRAEEIIWLYQRGRDNFSETYVRLDQLSGADLHWSTLRGAYLSGADLSGANLRGADLSGANLAGANLDRANLIWADLTAANLVNATLRGAQLTGAQLRCARLCCADLTYANLNGANLVEANLSPELDLQPAVQRNWLRVLIAWLASRYTPTQPYGDRRSRIKKAGSCANEPVQSNRRVQPRPKEENLSDRPKESEPIRLCTQLRWANLFGANLLAAKLQRADFRRADLRRTNLQGANLLKADLRRARLEGASLKNAIMPDGKKRTLLTRFSTRVSRYTHPARIDLATPIP